MLFSAALDTPDGLFTVVTQEDDAVVASGWGSLAAVCGQARLTDAPQPVATLPAAEAVRAYYQGDLAAPRRIAVAQTGSPMETAVWELLRTIPAGQTRSYGQVAYGVGKPGAARAVGGACGRNKVALFVPCHRVVGANGSLGGFGWGVPIKAHLLQLEGVIGDMRAV